MHKKLAFSLIFISSLSLGHNLPTEKFELLKKQAEERHLAEKEKTKKDLKIAGIAIVATIAASLFAQSYLIPEDLPIHETTISIGNFNYETGEYTSADVFLRLIETTGCLYSLYKGVQGAKHYYFPDNPKPVESKSEAVDDHA